MKKLQKGDEVTVLSFGEGRYRNLVGQIQKLYENSAMILLKDSVEIEGELRNKVVVSFRRLTKSGKPVIKTY
ncbi:hypothetical protein FHQ08_10330, partial [Lactobacillus sp. CC-MHH1034]|uniref:hypothetical protein n=1 Tax=Agrilactobacillus fermenti TaxID=2586909 RepID=UPI001E29C922